MLDLMPYCSILSSELRWQYDSALSTCKCQALVTLKVAEDRVVAQRVCIGNTF